MASIYLRKNESGTQTIRVVIRKKGIPTFCLSFEDWNEACDWVEEHEEKYTENYQSYIKWRRKNAIDKKRTL